VAVLCRDIALADRAVCRMVVRMRSVIAARTSESTAGRCGRTVYRLQRVVIFVQRVAISCYALYENNSALQSTRDVHNGLP